MVSTTVSVGADLAGTCAAIQLVTGVHWAWWVIPLAAFLGYALIRGSYRTITRGLLWLTPLFLLYVVTGIMVHPSWAGVLSATAIPRIGLTPTFAEAALGLLGATLSPYVFFWQSTEAVKRRRTIADLPHTHLDIAIGAIYATLIFYFIILTAGVLLFDRGQGALDIAEAASVLRPLAGPAAGTLFAFGVIASGLLTVPVMVTSSAHALAEAMGWAEGLEKPVPQARGFYLVLAGAMTAGCAIALSRVSPFSLMFWSQVLSGLLLPPLLLGLLALCNDRRLLDTHTNSLTSNLLGGGAVFITVWLAVLTLSRIAANL
jgi:Mn2+/Fe2+ NRAMP family transporter